MYNNLREKLWAFIIQNNPDLMFTLKDGYSVSTYLDDKISKAMPLVMDLIASGKEGHAIEELALLELTRELRPSKYNYIKEVIAQDFPEHYHRFREAGVLTFECINIIEACNDLFVTFDFREDKTTDNRLRHAIIARIHDYLSI
ncbi:MAG: hypothetical protein LBF27_13995 [Sphingobacterium sp.]|jgi:hypothetical protein|nr:hypothetical protein [Sphingobacterium sp.]